MASMICRLGVVLLALAVPFAPIVLQPALAAGCPAGTIEIGVRIEHTANATIIHHLCQEAPHKPPKSPTVAASPCASTRSSTSPAGVVNPGMYVTQADCRDALGRLQRLQKERAGYARKIDELERWRAGLSVDEKEIYDLRAEMERDWGWEFLEHAPVTQALDEMKGIPALEGVDIDKIKAGYLATVGLLETGNGMTAKNTDEQAEKIVQGNRELRNAMIALSGASEPTQKLLEGISKIFAIGATEMIKANAGTMSTKNIGPIVVLCAEAIEPWYGALDVAVNSVGYGVFAVPAATSALDSLRDAQSGNWHARRYLADKVDRLNDEIGEQQAIIAKYQMANGR